MATGSGGSSPNGRSGISEDVLRDAEEAVATPMPPRTPPAGASGATARQRAASNLQRPDTRERLQSAPSSNDVSLPGTASNREMEAAHGESALLMKKLERAQSSSYNSKQNRGEDNENDSGGSKPGRAVRTQVNISKMRSLAKTGGNIIQDLQDIRAILGSVEKSADVDGFDAEHLEDARTRAEQRDMFFITPHGAFMVAWDVTQTIVLIYVAIAVPLRLGYQLEPPEATTAQWWWDAVVDIYFLVDFFLNATLAAYVDQDDEENFKITGRYVSHCTMCYTSMLYIYQHMG